MNSHHRPDKAKGRSASFSSLFRFVFFNLLIAAFTFTSAQAQNFSVQPDPDGNPIVIPATDEAPALLQSQMAPAASTSIFAYVADPGNNSIAVIDTATSQVTATIPLPTKPLAVVGSPNGTRLYAIDRSANSNTPGNLYVIDTTNNSLVRTIPLPNIASASFVAITPDGKTIYWSGGTGQNLTALDIASGNVVATFPGFGGNGVLVTPDGANVYVANSLAPKVSMVSTAHNTVTATISPGRYPGYTQIGITPDGRFLYLPLYFSQVVVVDTASNTLLGSPISVSTSARSVSITPNGAFAYVAHLTTQSLSVIATSTNTVVKTIATTHPVPALLAFTPDGAFLYVTEEGGAVDVISTATNSIVATVPLAAPFGIAMVKVPPPPTAVAGPNQTITVGQLVHLDGSGSFAPNTKPADLAYAWSFVSRPEGSAATLTGANTATPSFTADLPGDFVVQLVVTDPATTRVSEPSQVTVSSIWSPPTANAGPAQSVAAGMEVSLNGTASTDPNGLPLTYDWSFVSKPEGSTATLSGSSGLATFTTDEAGTYVVQLVVSDPFGSSQPATVTITAITPGDYAQLRINEAINYIAAMPVASFDSPGHRNALTNHLQEAIADIQQGKIQAVGKLTNAIIRTDGFPLRGAADGNGPSMDWITTQTDQNFVYQKLNEILQMLSGVHA